MFTPLLRVVPSPNTKLDLAFIISFSFNPLSVFPYPTEKSIFSKFSVLT
jgi:hypothetical protein